MQVKKFEARTMKEALEMVKAQLGPDAIILSARDNNKSFGLVGQGSVEITAAVSEETLRKKQFVESRLPEREREKLLKSSARVQKKIINDMVGSYQEKHAAAKPITQRRYIDIDDEAGLNPAANPANERIRNAAQRAWSAMQSTGSFELIQAEEESYEGHASEETEIASLKSELKSLKMVLSQFQNIPQNIQNGQHPGAEYGLTYNVAPTFQKLTEAGVCEEYAAEILSEAEKILPPVKIKSRALVEGFVAKRILESTQVVSARGHKKMQIFVGPSGSGKTATLVKLASHYIVKDQKKVALLSIDTRKVGASEQMRIYAQILNVPFAVVRQKSDWEKVEAQLVGYDHILVDAPGLSLKTMEEISFLRNLLPEKGAAVHLVLSALAKDSDLTEIGKRYQVTDFEDVIFTSCDESMEHGSIYNFSKRFNKPIHSFGMGPRVPEDFELATKERVLDLIFKLSSNKKEITA